MSTKRPRPLRVAVIGPLMMPNRQGGMSRHCEEIYARLAARGHHVSIYCSSRPQGASYRGMHLRKVLSLGVPGWDRLGYSLLATLMATFGRYDVVHYHSLANTGFCFFPRATKKHVVVTIHRIEWQDEKWGAVTRAFLRWSEWCASRRPSGAPTPRSLRSSSASRTTRSSAGRRASPRPTSRPAIRSGGW